jgi:hypothetical protein
VPGLKLTLGSMLVCLIAAISALVLSTGLVPIQRYINLMRQPAHRQGSLRSTAPAQRPLKGHALGWIRAKAGPHASHNENLPFSIIPVERCAHTDFEPKVLSLRGLGNIGM